jgi:hypothetical protein
MELVGLDSLSFPSGGGARYPIHLLIKERMLKGTLLDAAEKISSFFCFSSSSWALLMRILTKESTLQKLLHCELRDWGGGRWEEEEDLDLST